MKKVTFVLATFVLLQLTVAWIPRTVQGETYEDPNKKILKTAVVGAGSGAIASGASGGNAGKGALIGAGTNVIGTAALDMLTTPSPQQQPQVVYVPQSDPGYTRVDAPAQRSGGCGRR